MKKKPRNKKTVKKQRPGIDAAYAHFGLKTDPFTTLSLQERNLNYFVGREPLIDRLSSSLFSLSNVGLAGEPGIGKSSLMRLLQTKVPNRFYCVSIGVPLDDARYFLSELLREILVVVPKAPGVNFKEVGRRLEVGDLSKNAVFSLIRSIVSKLKKPLLVFVDDLEKIKSDRIQHLTRSERTLQLLEEIKQLLELPNTGFAISLQEEFYSKVQSIVQESGDPTVLGLFKNIVLVERFTPVELRQVLETRLRQAGHKKDVEDFFEAEALVLAQALSAGNPRRFLYLLSEGMYRGYRRRGSKVEFQDLFEAVNEHLKLDLVCRKLLYFLARSGRVVASNSDLQTFMSMDMISIARRLEVLSKNRLAEMVEVVDGMKVYALPGSRPVEVVSTQSYAIRVTRTAEGEKVYNLPDTAPGPEGP